MEAKQVPNLTLVECPRDAMQGLHTFIPTERKVAYLQKLLAVGFPELDFGSFVSPKAIPQLRDTPEVLSQLNLEDTRTKLLAIVLNERGAQDAAAFTQVAILGYPLSISNTFQLRNANKDREASLDVLKGICEVADKAGKSMVVYLSMGFGNPYGEPWSLDLVGEYAGKVAELGVRSLSLADTAGSAEPAIIRETYAYTTQHFPELSFGAHFHARADNWLPKIEAAWEMGCRRFDGALRGYGGCPFAGDSLVGNVATENLIGFFANKGVKLGLNDDALAEAMLYSPQVFDYNEVHKANHFA